MKSLLNIPGPLTLAAAGQLLAVDPLAQLEPWSTIPVPPLREHFYDDQDTAGNIYTGPWGDVKNAGWPGEGAHGNPLTGDTNTIHFATQVQPGVVLSVETRRFTTTGTVEEGPEFYFSNELAAPVDIYIDGVHYTTLDIVGLYDHLFTYVYDMRREAADGAGGLQLGNANKGFLTQTLFPAGEHWVTIVKQPNAASGNNALYYDGWKLYTRDQTFSF